MGDTMKIIIEIEDLPGDKVRIVSNPTGETLMKMIQSGEEQTSAMGYAIGLLNKAREISKLADKDKKLMIQMPKVKNIWK
jgi:hypothetical protein